MTKNQYARVNPRPAAPDTIAALHQVASTLQVESGLTVLMLVEQYGELCRALLQDRPTDAVQAEALKLAAFALWLLAHGPPTAAVLADLAETMRDGRAKFPGNRLMLASLGEEVGELCGTFLHSEPAAVRTEALQVAGVALRIYEEGDAAFWNVPDEVTKP